MISLLLSDAGSGPCLVIAPTVAVLQWKDEIEKHTGNSLKVFLYIGM
jgi:DNA repair protein RAD16